MENRPLAGRDVERSLLASLPPTPLRPVFVIGLHRSGTTFLYSLIADAFPVASLTAFQVMNYERLLRLQAEGRTSRAERELADLFRKWGLDSRGIDNVPLTPDLPEEYGWVLRRRRGSFRTGAATAGLLKEICLKLQLLNRSARAVVLKNPWDTGRIGRILRLFPGACFIFLERDPVAIVNSQFGVAKDFGERGNPYVRLLFKGIPFGHSWLALQRLVRRTAGEKWHGRVALGHIRRSVGRELGRLESSWRAAPPRQRLALDYEGLVRDPGAAVERISCFLEIAPRRGAIIDKPAPRPPRLWPIVAAAENGFRRRLREKGIARRSLDELESS